MGYDTAQGQKGNIWDAINSFVRRLVVPAGSDVMKMVTSPG
jgi:hypothetical protein